MLQTLNLEIQELLTEPYCQVSSSCHSFNSYREASSPRSAPHETYPVAPKNHWRITESLETGYPKISPPTLKLVTPRGECLKVSHIVVLLPIFSHSCHSAVVPIVPGVVTQIINTLLFLLSAHQSSSQSNILITALPLMLLRSGMNSLMMCAVQHQLPPSERSLKHTCLQKHILLSLSCHPVSPWYDLAMFSD